MCRETKTSKNVQVYFSHSESQLLCLSLSLRQLKKCLCLLISCNTAYSVSVIFLSRSVSLCICSTCSRVPRFNHFLCSVTSLPITFFITESRPSLQEAAQQEAAVKVGSNLQTWGKRWDNLEGKLEDGIG